MGGLSKFNPLHVAPANRRTFRHHALGVAAALGVVTMPMPAAAETLQDAISSAYLRNPTLREQRFRQRSLNETYVQNRSQYGPTLNLTGQGVYSTSRFRGVEADSNNGEATLSFQQPLYTAGRLRGQLAAARSNVLAGQQELRRLEAETIQNVIIVYAAVIRDEQRLAVSRENVAVLQDQLRENRARRRVEDVTLTDVAQADARLAAAEFQVATLEATLAISRGQYLQVVGNNPGTLAALPDLPGMPGTSDQAYELADANNPGLATARLIEQASSANVAAARGEGGPSVGLSVEAGYSGQLSPFDSRNYRRTVAAGLTINQSLFASGQIASRIRQAQDLNDADQTAIDAARRQALQAVTVAWSQLSASRVALTSGLRQVASAQLAFAGMRREQRFGLRTTIEVLNAEQELQSAQLTLLQNRYAEYVSRGALLAATGRLEARYVAPDVALFDPEAEFQAMRNKGRTPLEPLAQALDRLGAAGVRRPLSADLTGTAQDAPDQVTAMPATPGAELTRAPLIPIRQSPLVPAEQIPGDHMPGSGVLSEPPPSGTAQ